MLSRENMMSRFDNPVPTFYATIDETRRSKTNVCIVVPCYNEAKRLDSMAFVRTLKKYSNLRFVFVDDGSKDDTLTVLQRLKQHNSARIAVLPLPQNGGKAEAVRQGLIYATNSGAKFVGYWDADLASPLSAIEEFAEVANRYADIDVIYGSRIQLLGHKIYRTAFRRLVSRVCSFLARIAVGLPIRDTQCGAKMLRNTVTLRNSLQHKFTADWLFDIELFARLSAKMENCRKGFYEFPLSEWSEIDGSKIDSKVIIKSGFRMLYLIFETRLLHPRKKPQQHTNLYYIKESDI